MTIDTDLAIAINKVSESRLKDTNLDDPGFGRVFSDHMLEMKYEDSHWQQAEIKPYGSVEVTPALNTLHYAQAVFEGTKAYYVDENTVNLFRLDKNWERMVHSCERLCIPPVEKEIFIQGIRELVKLDHKWIPKKEGNTLYIRPLACAFDQVIAARVSDKYRFFVITSPVGSYYNRPVKLTTSLDYVRAVKGGVGAAKAAGNYAASLYPARKAQEQGFDQILWLDAFEHKYIEEVGTMNIFFVIDGVLITPELRGTILPGVTRDSVIQLAQSWDLAVEERPISIDEVMEAGKNGTLDEMFGAGTAAVIAPVRELHHDGETVQIHEENRGPIGAKIYDEITGIQRGQKEDPFGWTHPINVG